MELNREGTIGCFQMVDLRNLGMVVNSFPSAQTIQLFEVLIVHGDFLSQPSMALSILLLLQEVPQLGAEFAQQIQGIDSYRLKEHLKT
mmetsp:Transcript_11819/g.40726  ORF Transcript_11819/g.40726 Transcript_11819/m.40726 type:complete len:88 (-) Transcript_11819:5528-5791(-)